MKLKCRAVRLWVKEKCSCHSRSCPGRVGNLWSLSQLDGELTFSFLPFSLQQHRDLPEPGRALNTHTEKWGDFSMAGASLCFSQETQMLFSILPCSRLGEAGVEQENSTLQRAPPFSSLCPLALMQGFFLHNIQHGIKTCDDKTPIFKTTSEAVTFQTALGKHSCSLGLLAGGPGEPGCKQALLLWSQQVILFLLLLLSLAWSAQSPVGAHQQPENFPGPAADPWGFIHRRSLTSVPCQDKRNGCHLKVEIKLLHILGTQPPFACLNCFQLKRQCPQQLLTGRNLVLRRPCKLW